MTLWRGRTDFRGSGPPPKAGRLWRLPVHKTYRLNDRPVVVHFASGNGGNKLYVIPERHMVVAIMSAAYGRGYGQRRSEEILLAVLAAGS